ncbi:maleylpyruvate isomerase family mycothiol-dependent enzyme [Humibacter ginsengiterrae]
MRRDFGEQIASTLVQLAGILEGLEPDEWGSQSLCDRWTVRDVTGHIVWRVGSSYSEMISTVLPMLTLSGMSLDSLTEAVSRQEAEATSPDELVRRLRRIAALRLAGLGRTGMTDLVETVVHTYDIVQPLGIPIEVEPDATRRIALRGLMLASGDRREVVATHTLYATDAGWAIGPGRSGKGRIIEGSAQGIVLYLFGRRPLKAPTR